MKIFWIRFETPHFEFDVFCTDEVSGRIRLINAWNKHCKETDADPSYIIDYVDDVTIEEVELNVVYKDKEKYL